MDLCIELCMQSVAAGAEGCAAHLHGIVEDVDGVLVVAADGEVGVALDVAARRRQVPAHQLQQRALARAVGAHQRHARIAVNAELQMLQHTAETNIHKSAHAIDPGQR